MTDSDTTGRSVFIWVCEGTWRAAGGARRLGRRCERLDLHGHTERAVVTASAAADLLIVARDGDRSRLGPRSLGRATRFVVDHAACPVLLVWPESAPDLRTIPPPPHDTPGGARTPGMPDTERHGL